MCTEASPFLYPIHRSGVGVCVKECPEDVVDGESLVNKKLPSDKSEMVCMEGGDVSKYTQATENFESLTPASAYKFGVCNYKYRTESLANRCYFVDAAAAEAFDYQVPDDFIVVFAQVIRRMKEW